MTFIIDMQGKIRGIHNSQMDPKGHIDLFKVKNKRGTDPATPNNNKIPVSPGILIELP